MTSTTSRSRAPHLDGRHGGIQLRQFRRRKLQGRGAGFSSICAIRDDEIRIHGRLDVLERLVMSGAAAAAVPRFVRKWRASVDETDNYVSAGAL
jgi:hypothetical protein